MASVKSLLRTIVKPILFKIMGKSGYKYAQMFGKIKDIKNRMVEEKEMFLLPMLIKKGDQVFDIGSNYAYYAERMSHLVGDNGKVYAFEPIPFTHDVNKMILKKLKIKNVELFKLGASNKNENIQFSIPKLNFGGISAGQAHIASRDNKELRGTEYYNFDKFELVDCQTVIIDDLLFDKIQQLSFIKCDIEGAEYWALQGMQKLIKKFKPILLLEIQPSFLKAFNINELEFRSFLTDKLNYELYKFDQNTKKLIPFSATFDDDNYILIHKEKIEQHLALISA